MINGGCRKTTSRWSSSGKSSQRRLPLQPRTKSWLLARKHLLDCHILCQHRQHSLIHLIALGLPLSIPNYLSSTSMHRHTSQTTQHTTRKCIHRIRSMQCTQITHHTKLTSRPKDKCSLMIFQPVANRQYRHSAPTIHHHPQRQCFHHFQLIMTGRDHTVTGGSPWLKKLWTPTFSTSLMARLQLFAKLPLSLTRAIKDSSTTSLRTSSPRSSQSSRQISMGLHEQITFFLLSRAINVIFTVVWALRRSIAKPPWTFRGNRSTTISCATDMQRFPSFARHSTGTQTTRQFWRLPSAWFSSKHQLADMMIRYQTSLGTNISKQPSRLSKNSSWTAWFQNPMISSNSTWPSQLGLIFSVPPFRAAHRLSPTHIGKSTCHQRTRLLGCASSWVAKTVSCTWFLRSPA